MVLMVEVGQPITADAGLCALMVGCSLHAADKEQYDLMDPESEGKGQPSSPSEAPVSHTPEHAIRECLASMSGHPRRIRPFWPFRPKHIWRGPGPLPSCVLQDTVRFVKKRDAPPRQLWWVTYEADGGWRGIGHWRWTVMATQEEPGRWSAHGVAGGGGAKGDLPAKGHPWADLGGTWGRDGFRVGGTVEDAGKSLARVRLTDVEGRTFDDKVDHGIVLFLSDEPVAMPMRVDLYDADGRVVGTDEWGFTDE